MRHSIKLFLLIPLVCINTLGAVVQKNQQGGLTAEELKQANNPLAHIKTVNIHNYVMPSLHGMPDVTMNSLMIRYAQPFGRVFLRASMPFMMSSAPGVSPTTGFGDFCLFAMYTFPNISEGTILGIGPMLIAPSGSHGFGQQKWQTGLSAVAFFSKSTVIQFGALLEWQISFAGTNKNAANVNMLIPQLFAMWQIGRGIYLRSTGIWSFDLLDGNYNVPLGLGMGKIVKAAGVIFNIFAEPQYSVLAHGIGQPKFQVFIGFNAQF